MDRLRLDKNRDSMRRNYHTIWKLFSNFFFKLDHKPTLWEDRIILFAGYLIHNNKRASTVKSYIAAIKSTLRDDGIEVSEDRYLLKSLTKACRYHNNEARFKLPLQKQLLHKIITQVD